MTLADRKAAVISEPTIASDRQGHHRIGSKEADRSDFRCRVKLTNRMRNDSAVISVLLDDSRAYRALRLAFRTGLGGPAAVQLRFVSSWSELRHDIGAELCDLAIVQPCFGMPPSLPEPNLPKLEGLASVWDRGKVILYLSHPNPSPSLFHDLGRLGFPFLLVQGIDDDPRSILRIVARAGARRNLRGRWREQDAPPDEATCRLVLDTVTGWPPATSAEELARHLKMSLRSLQRRLRAEGLPSPGKSISYGRKIGA